jgi:hypothetical protein
MQGQTSAIQKWEHGYALMAEYYEKVGYPQETHETPLLSV